MKPELYQEIALTQDWEEFNLHRGDIATLIDYVPSPTGGEEVGLFHSQGQITFLLVRKLYLARDTAVIS